MFEGVGSTVQAAAVAVEFCSPALSHDLETERLRMPIVCKDDFVHYRALMSDPEVMRYVGIEQGKIPTDEEVRVIVDGAVAAWNTRGYGRWSVFDKETGAFVGFCGFRCEGGVPELLCMVHERFWGMGYTTEAARAALDHGFRELAFNVVCSYTRPDNEKARTLLDRLGAEFIGNVDFHGVDGAAYRIRRPRL